MQPVSTQTFRVYWQQFINVTASLPVLVAQGFNLPNVLKSLQNLTYSYMNGQKANSSVGGLSLVALLMPYMTTISDTDSSYSVTQLQYISEQTPDLRFLYYAGGTVSRFSSFVNDPTQDLFPLNIGTNAATAGGPVVMRIKKCK